MSFDVEGDAYGRFMGRFSEPLAVRFVELVDAAPPMRALDVGCGPGALTRQLVDRLGISSVAAIDPSESFVAATNQRFPGIDARVGVAEQLPYADDAFDLCLAQLVVHFMTDPVLALVEMRRVTRPGGTIAASVWDLAGHRDPLAAFWRAVRSLDPAASDESERPGTAEGELVEIFRAAGLREVTPAVLTIHLEFESFDEWWQPFTLGVGPAGNYVAQLDETGRGELERRCAELLPAAPFAIDAIAWAAIGRV